LVENKSAAMKKIFLFLFLLFIACWGISCEPFTAYAISPDKNLLQIEVYAKQFSWTIRYGGSDNRLGASSYKLVTAENPLGLDSNDVEGYDDVIVTDTFFIPSEDVELQLHSRDVLHSVYLPHFKTQMNVVPGMTTFLSLKKQPTTAEMRITKNDSLFDYKLLCNKICGPKHYEMTMKVVVGTREEYWKWLHRHKPFFDGKKPPQQNINDAEGERR
jgi:cytochrome c oxidase subunit 2